MTKKEERIQKRIKKKLQESIQLSEENVLRLEKGKRGVLNLIFGRSAIILALLILQFMIVLSFFQWLEEYWAYYYIAMTALGLGGGIHILNSPGDPTGKMTWMVLVMAAPVFGAVLYVWVKMDVGHRLLHKRLSEIIAKTRDMLNTEPETAEKLRPNIRIRTTGMITIAARIFHKVLSLGRTGATMSSCTVGSGCAHLGQTVQSISTSVEQFGQLGLSFAPHFGHTTYCSVTLASQRGHFRLE